MILTLITFDPEVAMTSDAVTHTYTHGQTDRRTDRQTDRREIPKLSNVVLCVVLHPINIRVVPEVDHSGNNGRIVLDQNKFNKKVTHNRCKLRDL